MLWLGSLRQDYYFAPPPFKKYAKKILHFKITSVI